MYQPRRHPPLIWLLCGGPSPEAAVSLSSGLNAALALDRESYQLLPICVRKSGEWWFARKPLFDGASKPGVSDLFESFEQEQPDESIVAVNASGLGRQTREHPPDCALNLIHGEMGEDGVIQGLFEALKIPYTGSGVLASALTMNKILCQQALIREQIPVPPHLPLHVEPENLEQLARQVETALGYPCFVKPACGGSSIGVRPAANRRELLLALEDARFYDEHVLVERKISGIELTCGVLDMVREGTVESVAFPPTEIVPRQAGFFDYKAKYTPGQTDEITPARLDAEALAAARALALRAHAALGCEGMSRVDMIYSGGEFFVLEINSVPGMTQNSLFPQGAKAHGLSLRETLENLVRHAWWKYSGQ